MISYLVWGWCNIVFVGLWCGFVLFVWVCGVGPPFGCFWWFMVLQGDWHAFVVSGYSVVVVFLYL